MASESTPEALTLGISHIGLAVRDLAASTKFFEALGYFKVGGVESYPSVFFANANGNVVTLWAIESDKAVAFDRRANVGLHHLALQVASEEALDTAYATALAVPGTVNEFSPQDFAFGKHAMVYEPSGIRIEFAYNKK